MHLLTDAAKRAGLNVAGTLLIPQESTPLEAWEIAARTPGVTPTDLGTRIAPHLQVATANVNKAEPQALRRAAA